MKKASQPFPAIKWPKAASHAEASCFNCGADLDGTYWSISGAAPGDGQFKQYCRKCGKVTWYDLHRRTI